MDKRIAKQSIKDIKHSIAELSEFADYLKSELKNWKKQLDGADCLSGEIKSLAHRQYKNVSGELQSISKEINLYETKLESSKPGYADEKMLEELISEKKDIFMKLRSFMSLFASISTFLNWQSPSIKSSKNTRIGIEKYPVIGDYNDYKRDRSGDTFYCEKKLQQRLLKTRNTGVKPILNLCNCGMAAFTSILYFLIGENIAKNKVLASSDIYVENILLLKNFFKDKLMTFDYNETDLIVEKILLTEPDAVFLDPISNTVDMPLFDVASIIKKTAKTYKKEIYFIIDVTCSVGYENILDNFALPDNIKVIIHGSILKAPQLGMERIYAGFVLSFGLDKFVSQMLEYRTLSGSSIQDFGGYLLPVTTKKLLRDRLRIIGRNTAVIANFLYEIDANKEVFGEIVYPGIKSHKDFGMVNKIGFAGPFFNIKLIPKLKNDKYYELFASEVIKYAKRNNCDIVHGASYGFNITSIYYSVGWDTPDKHYLRLSIGTETAYEIEKLKKVFEEVFQIFKKRYSS